jgi:micrococcal nuclease
MSSYRLRFILVASITLTSLAMIWPGVCRAGANTKVSEDATGRSKVSASPTNIPPTPATGGTTNGIPAEQAKQHIGETNTVCGLVAGARFLESSTGKPTFLNFDRPFPDHTFSVVIFESNRAKFKSPPEMLYTGKTVCVTGRIVEYRGKTEIVVQDPSQIVLQETAPASAGGTSTNTSQKVPTSASPP